MSIQESEDTKTALNFQCDLANFIERIKKIPKSEVSRRRLECLWNYYKKRFDSFNDVSGKSVDDSLQFRFVSKKLCVISLKLNELSGFLHLNQRREAAKLACRKRLMSQIYSGAPVERYKRIRLFSLPPITEEVFPQKEAMAGEIPSFDCVLLYVQIFFNWINGGGVALNNDVVEIDRSKSPSSVISP